MLGRGVNEYLKHESTSYPWGNTLPVIKNADFKICNLECVITDRGNPWPDKTFHFRTDPKNAECLKTAGFSPVSIANNHTLDFGEKALDQMISILKADSINFAGAGQNLTEASLPALENGEKDYIGMIAFTDNELRWEAGQKKAGIFYVPPDLKDKRAEMLMNIVRKTRNDVKTLIVSAHWGPNWGYRVPNKHVTFAHALINAGADLIFGHSPHVVRGIEIYKGKPILYSTGNFVDDYAVDETERNDESFIFLIEIDPPKVSKITLIPTQIRNCQANLAKEYAEAISLKMVNLCKKLRTQTLWNPERGVLEVEIK